MGQTGVDGCGLRYGNLPVVFCRDAVEQRPRPVMLFVLVDDGLQVLAGAFMIALLEIGTRQAHLGPIKGPA